MPEVQAVDSSYLLDSREMSCKAALINNKLSSPELDELRNKCLEKSKKYVFYHTTARGSELSVGEEGT